MSRGQGNEVRVLEDDGGEINIHGTIVPTDVRQGEPVRALVKSRDPQIKFNKELRVWKLSPLGVELLIDGKDDILPKGMSIDLELTVGKQVLQFGGLVVDFVAEKLNRNFIGVRLIRKEDRRTGGIERRTEARWLCSDQFYPTVVASNPAKFNDFLYFKVRDISLQGAQLITSLRNKFIIPGMQLECLMSIPMIGQTKMNVLVKHVRTMTLLGSEYLAVGTSLVNPPAVLRGMIGQYLMQFAEIANPRDLVDSGLRPHSVSKAVEFSFVKSEQEYRQVLSLRYAAYKNEDKLAPGATEADMADIYDSRSRIVIGKYRGAIVACARLTFNSYDDKMEQEEFVAWPVDLPRRDESLEIMRACTHPNFRGSDLLSAMFQFIAITTVQAKRRWIIICATPQMCPLYEKIGFSKVGLSYNHAKLNDSPHEVLMADVPAAMMGRNVGPIVWNVLWHDVSKFLREYELITPDPVMAVRVGIYKLLRPLSIFLRYWSQRPRKSVRVPSHKTA